MKKDTVCENLQSGFRFDSGYFDGVTGLIRKERAFFKMDCSLSDIGDKKYLVHQFYENSDRAIFAQTLDLDNPKMIKSDKKYKADFN